MYDAYGGVSNASNQGSFKGGKGGAGGKRARPISAYPAPGSYPGYLAPISELGDSGLGAHLSKISHHQAARLQYVPHNIETFEKEKLYTETVSLKKQRNESV